MNYDNTTGQYKMQIADSLHFIPSLQSALCILYLVCILYPVCNLQSAFYTDRLYNLSNKDNLY